MRPAGAAFGSHLHFALFSHKPVDLETWKTDAVLDEESEVLSFSEKGRAGGDKTHSPPSSHEFPMCLPEISTVCGSLWDPPGVLDGWRDVYAVMVVIMTLVFVGIR